MGLAFLLGFGVFVAVGWGLGLAAGLERDEHWWLHLRVLVGVALVAIGCLFVLYSVSVHTAASVDGTVIASSSEQQPNCTDNEVESGCTIVLHLHYTYEYDGQTYESSGVWYRDGERSTVSTKAAARSWTERYEIDDEVSLIVDRDEPSRSAVRANFLKAYQWPLVVGPAVWFLLAGQFLQTTGLAVRVARRLET